MSSFLSTSSTMMYDTSPNIDEARAAAFAIEWRNNLVYGVGFSTMLTELLQGPPPGPQTSIDHSPLSVALSQRPASRRCQAFAHAANSILLSYYNQHPPTANRPAVLFLAISGTELGDDKQTPHILVALSDQMEIRAPQAASTTPDAGHPGECDLNLKGAYPPRESVVAVLEFGCDEPAALHTRVPAPFCPTPPQIGSNEDHRKRSRSTSDASSLSRPHKIRKPLDSSPRRVNPPQTHERSPPAEKLTDSSPGTSVGSCYSDSQTRHSPQDRLLDCFHRLFTGVNYRSWVSGAIIEGHQISLTSCDRGGLVQSSPVDMRTSEGFQLLCDWVLTLGSRSMEQWGFTDLFGNIGKQVQDAEFDVPLTNLHLSLGRLRYHQRGIFGRCTNVYDVTVRSGDTNIDGVCKIAWPLSSGSNEHELLEKVHTIDPAHTPDVYCGWDIPMELPSKRLRPHCINASPIEDRTMRVTVMTKYRPIDNLEGDDFLAAFTQIMQCNVRLYEAGCVHHRDLSPENMMYHRDATGRIIGVLTDFDLAVPLDEPMQDEAPQKLHGTAPFMPQALQRGKLSEHTLIHDFESALYILTWVAMGYKCGKPSLDVGDPLQRWREGSWEDIAEFKLRFLHGEDLYPKVVKHIRPEYKCLLKPIQALRTRLIVHIYTEILYQCLDADVPPFGPPFGPSQFFEHLEAK